MSPPAGREHRLLVDGRAATLWRSEAPVAGTTLVLCHGAGDNHRGWEELLPHLAGLDVIAPSLPGRCGSDDPPLETVAEMATWVRRVVRAAGAHRMGVVVVGHSLGGAVAQEYALAETSSSDGPALAGLVLVSTGARLRVNSTILSMMRQVAESSPRAGTASGFAAAAFLPTTDEALILRADARRAEPPPPTALTDWLAANRFDRMSEVHSIRVPTLLLCGSADALTPPRYAQYLAAQIAGATLELLDGAGHMLPFESPDWVAERVRRFLSVLGD